MNKNWHAPDAEDVAKAVMQHVILAYDTEKRLQKQELVQPFTIDEWVYEAGPDFYKGVVNKVKQSIELANSQIKS